ncbi:lysophospholipid acyltransferase family protein [Altericista sp. CCNU0014]|uniref:lysophospholipid acyltransferase family protein n=1 Tax=Altericista sp. CCNU0014 TaxID=3082949 RepID=UPI00384CC4D7
MNLASPLSYVSPWVYPPIAAGNRLLQRAFFGPLTVRGREHLPLNGPAVLAIKHYSRWDPLAIAQLQPKAIRFMTNANQFGGIQGWIIRRLGSFPVDLARPQKSSIKHAIELLHQGEILGIFPEGGIVRDRPLRSLKPGFARLILQAEATAARPLAIPITPIALRYQPEAQRGAAVYIDISPAFSSRDFEASSDKARAAQMTQHLEKVLRDRLEALRVLAGAQKQ